MAPRKRPAKRRRLGVIRFRRPHAEGYAPSPYRTAALRERDELDAALDAAPPRVDPAPLLACAVALGCMAAVLATFGLGVRAIAGVTASVALLGGALEELAEAGGGRP